MEEGMDFSNAFEKLQEMLSSENGQEQIQNILNTFTGGRSEPDDNLPSLLTDDSNPGGMPDMDMLFKLQKIMSLMKTQKNTAQTDFLLSLKPLLTKNRRDRVDSAVKLMGAIKVMKMFKAMNEEGD